MGILQDEVEGDVGAAPRCGSCGSERVVKDAWAAWNAETGLWELETVFDQAFCQTCETSTTLAWHRLQDPTRQRVRELNDQFRRHGQGRGSIMVTAGVQERGADFVLQAVTAVRKFDAFNEDNDPWGEHDFGAVEVDGERIFWKIDYYDPSLTYGSDNPANEGATHRVLTVMLASEY